MKCEQCGKELRIEREEYCKDVNGNPMYRDVAYCDTCKTKTPLKNEQTTNNFSPSFGTGSGQIINQKPPKKKIKTWQIILIVFLAIGFIGTILSDDDSDKEATEVMSEKKTNKDAENSKNKKDVKVAKETAPPKTTPKQKATKKPKATLSPKQKKAKEKKDKKSFITSCKAFSYKKVMRNPKKYVRKKIKIKCQISQISEGGLFTEKFFRCYSYSGYGIYAENEYVIYDKRISSSPKLLDNDIITVYGTIEEPEEVTRALTGTSDEVFTINMKYVKLHNE